MVRENVAAGQFYPNDFGQLNKELEECFESERGPGALPVSRKDTKIHTILVPHAGYHFSGPCAAWAYKEVGESKLPKTYVLLGPNHHGMGTGLSIEDWRTPFGLVKTEKNVIRDLKDTTDLQIKEQHHLAEHALEVQLPFLQFVNKDRMQEIRIVPITISRDIDFKKLGKQLFEYSKNKDFVFIISSDFTHYGPNYGYVPFASDIPKNINEMDQKALELIMNYDTEGFKNYINKTGITICGYMPILLWLAMMENYDLPDEEDNTIEKPVPHLLMHYTSGDVIGDYKNSVSYASILFK